MKWRKIKTYPVETFQLEDKPEVIHVIKTGFEDRYHVVEENAYEMFERSVMITEKEIEDKYKIKITI